MDHCVILLGEFYPTPSANGVCIEAIVNEFTSRNYKVDIICYGDDNCFGFKTLDNNIFVHTIMRRESDVNKGKGIRHRLKQIPNILIYPMRNANHVNQYLKILEKINENSEIDFIIACQMPFDSTRACSVFKGMHPEIKFVIYELDPLGNNLFNNLGWRKLFIKKCKKLEKAYFKSADIILHLECNRNVFIANEYLPYASKSFFVDIPLIDKKIYERQKNLIDVERKDDDEIKMIYGGALLKFIREPNYIIELIKMFSQKKKCLLTFYSKGSCEETVRRAADKNICIESKGYVAESILYKEMANSDFLISIGNLSPENNNAIPSKIFVYMSTGKPIIHVLSGEHDICKQYLKNYPNALLLDPKTSMQNNLTIFTQFVKNKKGSEVPFEDLIRKFYKNTPGYTVDVIENAFVGESHKNNNVWC